MTDIVEPANGSTIWKNGRGYYKHGLEDAYTSEENSTEFSMEAVSDPEVRKKFVAIQSVEESSESAGLMKEDGGSLVQTAVYSTDRLTDMNATAWREMYSRIYASAWNAESKNNTYEDESEQENVEMDKEKEPDDRSDEDNLAVKDLYKLVPPSDGLGCIHGWEGHIEEEFVDTDFGNISGSSDEVYGQSNGNGDERDRTEWPAEEWDDVDPDKVQLQLERTWQRQPPRRLRSSLRQPSGLELMRSGASTATRCQSENPIE
eukprot:755815-Hanusia_phi.AAC.2